MKTYQEHSISLRALFSSMVVNRSLIWQMTKRDVVGRYRGSAFGLAWSFFRPMLLLAVYTFIFSVVFKTRWSVGGEESKVQFASVLFAGLICHALFAEIASLAPILIVANTNYVKKVVFPLEILPVVSMGAALFHALVSLSVLLFAFLVFNGFLHFTVLLTPLVLLPLIVGTLGFGLGLSSLGVFFRDIAQPIEILVMVMLFASGVFFSIERMPEVYRPWLMANPLAFTIAQVRSVVIWGDLPNWSGLLLQALASVLILWLGFVWFQKTRKGFADVL